MNRKRQCNVGDLPQPDFGQLETFTFQLFALMLGEVVREFIVSHSKADDNLDGLAQIALVDQIPESAEVQPVTPQGGPIGS